MKVRKIIPVLFLIMMFVILLLLLAFDWVDYYFKVSFMTPNIVAILIIFVVMIAFGVILSKAGRVREYLEKNFTITVYIVFVISLILQFFIIKNIYFKTGWDAGIIDNITDIFATNGSIGNNAYLSLYPNNLVLTAIIAIVKTSPILRDYAMAVPIFNALLISASGLVACLTVKKLASKTAALCSLALIVPLLLLSPWINIAYSDTFAALFPVLILFIYTIQDKRWYHFVLIGLFSAIGYLIKPTVIIILLAIIIVEILYKSIHFKQICFMIVGLLLGLLASPLSSTWLGFVQDENVHPTSFMHYLIMGQNNRTLGAYADEDQRSFGGKIGNLEEFWKRFSGRTPIGQIEFYAKKTLLNFNDGTFSWGAEGNFYNDVSEPSNSAAITLRKFYYNNGEYYPWFMQIQQTLWLITLIGAAATFSDKRKSVQMLMLSLIGITAFLTFFEPRARYLICYVPLFVICSILGWRNIYNSGMKKFSTLLVKLKSRS